MGQARRGGGGFPVLLLSYLRRPTFLQEEVPVLAQQRKTKKNAAKAEENGVHEPSSKPKEETVKSRTKSQASGARDPGKVKAKRSKRV